MKYYSIIAFSGTNSANARPSFSRTTLIHAPYFLTNCIAYNCILEENENASGTFSFSVTRDHPSTPYIKAGTIIEVRELDTKPNAETITDYLLNCGKTIWIGRMINMTIDIYGNKECSCEGMLGFLKDIFAIKYGSSYNDCKVADALHNIINAGYNYASELTTDGFYVNSEYAYPPCLMVNSIIYDTDISLLMSNASSLTDYFEYTYPSVTYKGNNQTVFDLLNDMFENFGQKEIDGYSFGEEYLYAKMEIIHPEEDPSYMILFGEPRIIGFRLRIGLDNPTKKGYPTGDNRLVFGESLSAASISYDFTKTFTTLKFIGGETIEYGMKTQFGVNIDNLTTKQVANGVLDSTNGSISEWGIIPGIIEKSEITDQGNMNLYANVYRNIAANPVSSFTASGIDMSYDRSYYSEITIGTYYEVRFPGQDFDNNVIGAENYLYRCVGRKLNLLNPGQNEYKFSRIIGTFSNGISTMSSRLRNRILKQVRKETQAEITGLKKQISELTSELEENKKQLQVMSKAMKLNVSTTEEKDNKLKEEEIQNGEINGISGDHSVTAE